MFPVTSVPKYRFCASAAAFSVLPAAAAGPASGPMAQAPASTVAAAASTAVAPVAAPAGQHRAAGAPGIDPNSVQDHLQPPIVDSLGAHFE